MRAHIVGICMTLVMGAAAVKTQNAAVDVTGKWTFQVESDLGGGTPTVTLMQQGEKLTGHYSSMNLGEADLTGSVKGRDITFSFEAEAQGISLDVTYTGTIDGKDTMKGKVAFGEFGGGTFTGKRQ